MLKQDWYGKTFYINYKVVPLSMLNGIDYSKWYGFNLNE